MENDPHFVPTKDIKAAVTGREPDILSALGIGWRPGAAHIRCPYGVHPDKNPSWRWDERRRIAVCTCTNGQDKPDTIFDVAAKVRGGDFEQAKLWIAEIIGRSDLIKARGAGGQRTDAGSLLNPPADNRDDCLVASYLAFRLGVDPAAVPLPATRAVGWRALGYYDPPASANGKPSKVSEHPCAVFETVAADGRRHAHRVYLAWQGRGKADLGRNASGQPRDPKKSARKQEGDDTAGRSVLWGDTSAPTALLCEGIETACAVAHAYRQEAGAGSVMVASAISEGGVRAWQPWPETKHVVVCADRDEGADDDGKPRGRQGEAAARAFATKHHDRLDVAIALPGEPGTKTDWLDVSTASGIEAVRSGIEAAVPFVPTAAERTENNQRKAIDRLIVETSAAYPLPTLKGARLSYVACRDGEVWVHEIDPRGRGEPIPVFSPIGVLAWVQRSDGSTGLRVVLSDPRGQPCALDIERGLLARAGGSEVLVRLMAAGLRVAGDGGLAATKMLREANPDRHIVTVDRPGWHGAVFVCPSGEVIGADDRAIELAEGIRLAPGVAEAGSLAGWQEGVALAVRQPNCPHFIVGVAAGCVGPLIALLELDTCGLSLGGDTSLGKTSSLRLSASAWGAPTAEGMLSSLKVTNNSPEALAERAHATVLALDEMGHADGKLIAGLIYGLASNQGKARLDRDAKLKAPRRWRTFALLSGECSIRDKITGEGGGFHAGQAVRVLDISVAAVNAAVPRETIETITLGLTRNFGHAGPEFIRRFIAEGEHRRAADLRGYVTALARQLTDQGGAEERAAVPLALVWLAGAMMIEYGLLPADTPIEEAVCWAWTNADRAALDPEGEAIEDLKAGIAEQWDVGIRDLKAHPNPNRQAVGWYDDHAVYVPTGRLAELARSKLTKVALARALEKRGMLAARGRSDRVAVTRVPLLGDMSAYALSRRFFGRGAGKDEQFTVHEAETR